MLIVKGVNIFPEAIRRAILRFCPQVTGSFKIVLDRPGPLVTPPLRIKIEHSSTVDEKGIPSLEEKMEKHFKEQLRISPKFIWVDEGSIPRELKKTKFIQIEGNNV
jgi:phenylacetate-CoA ligase